MVVVWIAGIAAAVVVIGVIVARRSWRPGGDEVHSVRHYQSALSAIEEMSNRNATASFRSPHEPGDPRGTGSEPRDGGGGEALVFDDTRPRERHPFERDQLALDVRSDRARRHAIQSMDHRPHRWGFGAAVVLLLAVIAGLVYLGSRHTHHNNQATASHTSTTTSAATVHHTSGPVRHHGASGPSTTAPKGTTTTVPSQIMAVSTSSSGASARYPAPNGAYQLTVAATSGTCWVQVTDATSGNTLWTGTLQPGASQVVQATGETTALLGSSTASLAVNGVPVAFPTPFQTPFTATLVPGASSAAGSGAAGSSTTTTTASPANSTGSSGSAGSTGSGSSASGTGSSSSASGTGSTGSTS